MHIKLKHRFIMAWKAFFGIPFDIQLRPYYYGGHMRKGYGMPDDNQYRTGCKNEPTQALYQDRAVFRIDQGTDSYFLCDQCALKALGTDDKLPFDFEK